VLIQWRVQGEASSVLIQWRAQGEASSVLIQWRAQGEASSVLIQWRAQGKLPQTLQAVFRVFWVLFAPSKRGYMRLAATRSATIAPFTCSLQSGFNLDSKPPNACGLIGQCGFESRMVALTHTQSRLKVDSDANWKARVNGAYEIVCKSTVCMSCAHYSCH
jgi:hypothetical protein